MFYYNQDEKCLLLVLDKTLKRVYGVRLDNRKILRARGPITGYLERFFFVIQETNTLTFVKHNTTLHVKNLPHKATTFGPLKIDQSTTSIVTCDIFHAAHKQTSLFIKLSQKQVCTQPQKCKGVVVSEMTYQDKRLIKITWCLITFRICVFCPQASYMCELKWLKSASSDFFGENFVIAMPKIKF